MSRTQFFKSCLGVFQGGGCRGAALAGAYTAAVESGVHFSEVAGTSAGSIITVLIGAGATPEFVWNKLKTLDFGKFMGEPENITKPAVGYFGRKLISYKSKELAKILSRGGLYSSTYIADWIDETLAELLPEAQRPIRFEDLVKPTYVVASNVQGARPHVWSTYDTKDEFVGTAVRASCSIPFFFQAVEFGGNKFVDGGLLSNLPLFVFAPKSGIRRPASSKILAFRLVSDHEKLDLDNFIDFSKALTSVVVDGATELQCRLHRELHEVKIPTGKIKATDFEKLANDANGSIVANLFKSGFESTTQYIANELSNVRVARNQTIECEDEDATYFAVIELGEESPEEIFVVCKSARWAWELFPTLLNWLNRGVHVRVLLGPASERDGAEQQRRTLLSSVFSDVTVANELTFEGFFFRNRNLGDCSAIILSPSMNQNGPAAAKYRGDIHGTAITSMLSVVESMLPSASRTQIKPLLEGVQVDEYYGLLKRGVSQYSNSTLSFENVQVRNLLLTAGDIREYKYRQIVSLARLYGEYGITPFSPVRVKLNRYESLVTPPVVEASGSQHIVVQGNTRAAYCLLNNMEEIPCIVVRNVTQPLPVQPVGIRRMRVVTQREQRYLDQQLYQQSFRKIERAIRPYS